MVIARVIMKPQDECRDCELDAACYVLIWPFIVAFVGLYGSLELLGRVVMWRKY